MSEVQTPTPDEGKRLRQLLDELKVALDQHDRLMNMELDHRNFSGAPRFCWDDPRIAEQDRLNSLPEVECEED